jgi:hypothetical protein
MAHEFGKALAQTFGVDYSQKVLHVAIAEKAKKDGKKITLRGLVYYAPAAFSKVNTMAEQNYADFFKPGEAYRVLTVSTEMGPGEFAKVLKKKYKADHSWTIGGMTAGFSLPPAELDRLVKDIIESQASFRESAEKKIFA